jgi:hypothetical protein
MIKYNINRILENWGYTPITKKETRKNKHYQIPNWEYQKKVIEPLLKEGDLIIDIGSGHNPSPRANILSDFFPDDPIHRGSKLVEDRPTIICSLEKLPFQPKSIDFAICSHVFEHLENPNFAASELSAVAKAGYIETPAYGKDILVGTGNIHLWQVVSFKNEMHFFQYTERQHQAHTLAPIMEYWGQEDYHPWQPFFSERQDLFNASHVWKDQPTIIEHRFKESVRIDKPWEPIKLELLPSTQVQLTDKEIGLLERCLATPDRMEKMTYKDGRFVNSDETLIYPVRGKRVYVEIPEAFTPH